jgi:glyoxylase-like metal-dependent hydrolase (beta-lactamase superfamily II)
MNRILTTAAAAVLFLSSLSLAQAPGTASRQEPKAQELPPFETAQIDAASWAGRFGSTTCAWFDMGDGILLLDTGGTATDAKNLLAEVKRTVPGKPVRWTVMTHLHADSNNGFAAMLPTDLTLIVNRRAVEDVQGLVHGGKGKTPTVLGVEGTLVLVGKTQKLEIHATPTPAHTEYDVWVFSPTSNAVYVGDLVTPNRCPMTSDIGSDPKGWIGTLNTIESLHASTLVATRGPFTTAVTEEIAKTRAYLNRTVGILREMKAVNAPEARVSGELFAKKLGDYCPVELDTINALELYRRMRPDGSFAAPEPTPPSRPAPPAKKK